MRAPNKELRAVVQSLAFGGDGVARLDGKVYFIEGALPGEEVLFDVVKDTANYAKGKLKEIIVRSPDRVEPVCRYYGKCGGCQLQHVTYEKELVYKEEQLGELLRRISGKKDVRCERIEPSPDPYHYRSSITLHRKNGPYGYYKVDGYTIMAVEECPLAEEAISKELKDLSFSDGKESLTIKTDWAGKVWISDKPGERFFIDRYGDTELYVSPKAFTQANRYIALEIAKTLTDWIGPVEGPAAFFDAFCGIGFYTFLVKRSFALRVGMDTSRIAIDCAKSTARQRKRDDAKFYFGDAETEFLELFGRLKQERNILFLDPPRKGAGKDLLDRIKGLDKIDGIYYLSCDPARLARDIKIITEDSAWELGRVKPFDMFPRTKHIETLAEFIRRK